MCGILHQVPQHLKVSLFCIEQQQALPVLLNTKSMGKFQVQCVNFKFNVFLVPCGIPPKKWCWRFEAPKNWPNTYDEAYRQQITLGNERVQVKLISKSH